MGVWLNKDDFIRDLKRISLCLLILYVVIVVGTDQNFYSLLGVSKTASSREIRQAFKKLALKLHPDKNPNNPNAHGDFLKINRAYEVLKDEDLRKKYDKYGEKGLEDNQGGQYESWSYYTIYLLLPKKVLIPMLPHSDLKTSRQMTKNHGLLTSLPRGARRAELFCQSYGKHQRCSMAS